MFSILGKGNSRRTVCGRFFRPQILTFFNNKHKPIPSHSSLVARHLFTRPILLFTQPHMCGKVTEIIRLCSQHVTKIHSPTLFREELFRESKKGTPFLSSTDGILHLNHSPRITRMDTDLSTTNDCFKQQYSCLPNPRVSRVSVILNKVKDLANVSC